MQVIATPTLVKILPEPLRRIIGDLSDQEKVLAGLNLDAPRSRATEGPMTDRRHDTTDYESLSGEELISRLREAEETLDAIRNGEVDAVVVAGPEGQQSTRWKMPTGPIGSWSSRCRKAPLRCPTDGTILYCNERFATLVGERARQHHRPIR